MTRHFEHVADEHSLHAAFSHVDQAFVIVMGFALSFVAVLPGWLHAMRGRVHFHFYHLRLYHLLHHSRFVHLARWSMIVSLAACVCAFLLCKLVLVKSQVHNVRNPRLLRTRTIPRFVSQSKSSKALKNFCCRFHELLATDYPDSLAKAVAIRRWVRQQQPSNPEVWKTPFRINHEDPARLLEEQRRGIPGACRRFSYILLGALLSEEFEARIVCFTDSLYRRGSRSHVAVEVWIEELHQWVFLDPTFDTLVLVEGKPAAALDLQLAVAHGKLNEISFERDGAAESPHPSHKAYARYCRHLFVPMSNAIFDSHPMRAFGPNRLHFLHYSGGRNYPVFRKYLALSVGAYGLGLSMLYWMSLFLLLME